MAIAQTPDILGERQSGQDVRTQNVVACQAVANIVKSSLGPVGLDKMLVDDIGDVTITNDGATILKMLEVEHPAAKVLVELAELQDRERANDLVRDKIHPTSIISGYRLAMREACKYVKEKLSAKVVDAVQAVKTTNARGEVKYPIKSINILKAHGKSAKDSYLLNGYALNTGRATQGMPTRVSPAKVACLDFNLQKTKMQMGIQVLATDPREIEKIREREADITKERIKKLLKAGANVVLTTKGIDDMSLKYFVEAGAIAVRRVRKEDLRHVAKATGATVVTTFADMEGEETFDATFFGHADEVVEERIADDDVILIKGTKNSSAVLAVNAAKDATELVAKPRAYHHTAQTKADKQHLSREKMEKNARFVVHADSSFALRGFLSGISGYLKFFIYGRQTLHVPHTLFEGTRGVASNRPLSPHLPVEKSQLLASLSISHRIFGASMTLAFLSISKAWKFSLLFNVKSKNFQCRWKLHR